MSISVETTLSLLLVFVCITYISVPWLRSVMSEDLSSQQRMDLSQDARRKALLEEIEFEYHTGKISQESYEKGKSEIESVTKSEISSYRD